MRKFGRWSLIFSKKFPLVQCQSLKSIKKLSMRDACSFSVILVGPRICGVNHFAVRKSRNSVISLFLSNLSKFRLKSPVSIIFFFSFFIFLMCYWDIVRISCLFALDAYKLLLLECYLLIDLLFLTKAPQIHFVYFLNLYLGLVLLCMVLCLLYKLHTHLFLIVLLILHILIFWEDTWCKINIIFHMPCFSKCNNIKLVL